MKGIASIVIGLAFLVSCGTNRNNIDSTGRVSDEPLYKKDRRLGKYSESRTNSHGSVGPGNGSSYASTSYRQSAIKAENDSVPNQMDRSTRHIGRDVLAADTLDTGVSW